MAHSLVVSKVCFDVNSYPNFVFRVLTSDQVPHFTFYYAMEIRLNAYFHIPSSFITFCKANNESISIQNKKSFSTFPH